MFRELLDVFRFKKRENKIEEIQEDKNVKPEIKKIFVAKQNDMYRVDVLEDMSLREYKDIINSDDGPSMNVPIPLSILLDEPFQRVRKGIYYLIKVYNLSCAIRFTDNEIYISERIRRGIDDRELDFISYHLPVPFSYYEYHYWQYRCLSINLRYFGYSFKHMSSLIDDKIVYSKYYYPSNEPFEDGMCLTDEDAFDQIQSVLNNLEANIEDCDELRDLLNIDLLKDVILGKINNKIVNRRLKQHRKY